MNLTSINRLSAFTQPPYVFAALLAPTSKPPALQLAPSKRAAPSSLDSLEVLTSMKKCLINSKESTNKALHKFSDSILVPAPSGTWGAAKPEGTTSAADPRRYYLQVTISEGFIWSLSFYMQILSDAISLEDTDTRSYGIPRWKLCLDREYPWSSLALR